MAAFLRTGEFDVYKRDISECVEVVGKLNELLFVILTNQLAVMVPISFH